MQEGCRWAAYLRFWWQVWCDIQVQELFRSSPTCFCFFFSGMICPLQEVPDTDGDRDKTVQGGEGLATDVFGLWEVNRGSGGILGQEDSLPILCWAKFILIGTFMYYSFWVSSLCDSTLKWNRNENAVFIEFLLLIYCF